VPLIILTVLLSAATYRVTRFLISDTLISEQRRWVKLKLMGNGDVGPVRVKLLDLLSCPYCLSVWVAAAGVLASQQFQSIPQPVLAWLAVCTGSLAFWRYIEND